MVSLFFKVVRKYTFCCCFILAVLLFLFRAISIPFCRLLVDNGASCAFRNLNIGPTLSTENLPYAILHNPCYDLSPDSANAHIPTRRGDTVRPFLFCVSVSVCVKIKVPKPWSKEKAHAYVKPTTFVTLNTKASNTIGRKLRVMNVKIGDLIVKMLKLTRD